MVSTMCSYLVPSCMLAMPTMANYRQEGNKEGNLKHDIMTFLTKPINYP